MIGALGRACDAGRADARAGVRERRGDRWRGLPGEIYRDAWARETAVMKACGQHPQLRFEWLEHAECP